MLEVLFIGLKFSTVAPFAPRWKNFWNTKVIRYINRPKSAKGGNLNKATLIQKTKNDWAPRKNKNM